MFIVYYLMCWLYLIDYYIYQLYLMFSIFSSIRFKKRVAIFISAITLITSYQTLLNSGVQKHILLWLPDKCNLWCKPFEKFGEGNFAVVLENCAYQNCYVTKNRSEINIEDFEVLLFHGRRLNDSLLDDLPKMRKPNQLYAFVQIESSAKYPVCYQRYKDFFNLTITHRLNSDIPWPYFLIKDVNNVVIAPNVEPKWRETYEDISGDLKHIYDKKDKLAAWFASNCESITNKRDVYIRNLNKELVRLSNVSVDIYGKCGTLHCPRSEQDRCDKLLEDHYLFYMAFENSSEQDYVTEKVYTALHNNVIPVVFGGAKYQRFLPPSSFINAGDFEPYKLAEMMIDIYSNRTKSYEYFKWKKYYHVTLNSRGFFCKLCEILNSEHIHKRYEDLISWWNLNVTCEMKF